jgi:hypothetical protein
MRFFYTAPDVINHALSDIGCDDIVSNQSKKTRNAAAIKNRLRRGQSDSRSEADDRGTSNRAAAAFLHKDRDTAVARLVQGEIKFALLAVPLPKIDHFAHDIGMNQTPPGIFARPDIARLFTIKPDQPKLIGLPGRWGIEHAEL